MFTQQRLKQTPTIQKHKANIKSLKTNNLKW